VHVDLPNKNEVGWPIEKINKIFGLHFQVLSKNFHKCNFFRKLFLSLERVNQNRHSNKNKSLFFSSGPL
jgi:hypothetical protein